MNDGSDQNGSSVWFDEHSSIFKICMFSCQAKKLFTHTIYVKSDVYNVNFALTHIIFCIKIVCDEYCITKFSVTLFTHTILVQQNF